MSYFLKKTLIRGRESKGRYLQIYEGHHDPQKGRTVNTSYRTYGYENDLISKGHTDPVAEIQMEVDRLNAGMREKRQSVRKVGRSDVRYCGYFPLKAVMNTLDIRKHFGMLQMLYDKQYEVYELFEALVYARAVNPCSKLRTLEEVIPYLYEYSGSNWSYDTVLDCCGFVGQNMNRIVEILSVATKEKYGIDTSSTFFDCTNFYFEIDAEDWLRRRGPSKENRSDPIIGMGLLLDCDQIPIGLRMYPGNQSEKPVMRQVISDVRSRGFAVGRTIQVADKGLNCARNIHETINANDGYIFSKSVKMLSQKEKDWVFAPDAEWTDVYEESDDGARTLKYRYRQCQDSFPYEYDDDRGQHVPFSVVEKRIVTFSPSLARKKKAEILKMVQKAMNMAPSAAKRSELGECAKYVSFKAADSKGNRTDGKVVVEMDMAAVERDLMEAGYNMIVTSELYMEPEQIYSTYHRLWRIEETFRIMKSELDARPVYLQDYDRIFGHFLICYTSVLLMRILELKILKDRVPPQRLFQFIRGFSVMEMEGLKCINITKAEHLVRPLQLVFESPLDNYYLSKAELKKLFSRNIYARDADGNILR